MHVHSVSTLTASLRHRSLKDTVRSGWSYSCCKRPQHWLCRLVIPSLPSSYCDKDENLSKLAPQYIAQILAIKQRGPPPPPLDSALKTRCLAAETLQWELIRFWLSHLDSARVAAGWEWAWRLRGFCYCVPVLLLMRCRSRHFCVAEFAHRCLPLCCFALI